VGNPSSSFGTFNVGMSNGDGRVRSGFCHGSSSQRGLSPSRKKWATADDSSSSNNIHNRLLLGAISDGGESPRIPSTSQPRMPLLAATNDDAAHLLSSRDNNANANARASAGIDFENDRAGAPSRRSPSRSPPSRSPSHSPSRSSLPPFAFPYPSKPPTTSTTTAHSSGRSESVRRASPPSHSLPPSRAGEGRSVRDSSLPRYLDHLNRNARAPAPAPAAARASQPRASSANQRLPERRLVTPLSLHERLAADARARKFQSRKAPGFIWDFPGDEIAPMQPAVS